MTTFDTAVIEEGKIPSEYITGDVSYKKQSSNIHPENTVIKEVSFVAGSRCNWHINRSLQLFIVTDGIGYFQEKGSAMRLVHKDEVVTVLPGMEHWYGATPYSRYAHIAIVTEIDKGPGIWLEKVTDEQYDSFGK
jgi:quercetin dioxygenase-like cupin family protein